MASTIIQTKPGEANWASGSRITMLPLSTTMRARGQFASKAGTDTMWRMDAPRGPLSATILRSVGPCSSFRPNGTGGQPGAPPQAGNYPQVTNSQRDEPL